MSVIIKKPGTNTEYKDYYYFRWKILRKPLGQKIDSIKDKLENKSYHLAALLSTQSELSPNVAHEVNVTGTLNMLTLASEQSKKNAEVVKFFFPSSIAVYGLKNEEIRISESSIREIIR